MFWNSVFLNHTLSQTFGSHIKLCWWTLQDSNLQPTGYEPVALTIELRVQQNIIILIILKIDELIFEVIIKISKNFID